VKPLSLEEIREAIHGHWLAKGRPGTIKSVSTDTRTAQAGDLFVAIRGRRFDGHGFLPQAAQAGCAAAIVALDGEPRPDVASRFPGGVLGAQDTVRALGRLAGYHRSLLPAAVIAVTGSNGKTTVKGMIHHILSRRMAGTCSPRSFNNEIGVPLTLLEAGSADDYIVCEIGSSAPGEIAMLSQMACPEVTVITNVAETHLEKLISLERVAAEKASILASLPDDGLGVIWADSDLLGRLARSYRKRVVRFGSSDHAELRLTDYRARRDGQRFQLNDRLWVRLPLRGRHNAANALAAIAVAQRFGFSQAEAAEALADFRGVEMRLEWLDCGAVTVINDAYNANPASVLAAAGAMAEGGPGRRVVIAGDMRELGPRARELHLQVGRKIARCGADLLIGVGTLGRYIAMGAAETGLATETFKSVDQACRDAVGLLAEGDLVLVKGSRAMEMERLVEPIRKAFQKVKSRKH